jgi:hypothetical protein
MEPGLGRPARAEQAVRAESRQEPVPEPVADRDFARQQIGWEQPLDEVVVAAVAFAPRDTEHAGDRVRLQHGADDVRRRPPPLDRRTALEVERRQRPLGADPLQDLLRHFCVLREDPRRADAPCHADPRQLARRQEAETLVVRLEQLAPCVEKLLATGWVVVGNASVEHEVVVPAGDGERVELDQTEPAEDLEHRIGASFERARGGEEVACDQEASRGLGACLQPTAFPNARGFSRGPSRWPRRPRCPLRRPGSTMRGRARH